MAESPSAIEEKVNIPISTTNMSKEHGSAVPSSDQKIRMKIYLIGIEVENFQLSHCAHFTRYLSSQRVQLHHEFIHPG